MQTRPPIPNPEDYGIDLRTGFVPSQSVELPAYYAPWRDLCSKMPELLQKQTARSAIDALDILDTKHLATLAHWQRAYILLGYLSQAYIWQDRSIPSSTVPASVADPFLKACDHLGMQPVLSYAGSSLWNWEPNGRHHDENHHTSGTAASSCPDLADFSTIKCYTTFTGTRDEDSFNLVPSMVEAESGRLIPLLLNALDLVHQHQVQQKQQQPGVFLHLLPVLEECTRTLTKMHEILSVLFDNCDPSVFHQDIRPMLAGSAAAEDKGLPAGVTFQCSDGSRVVAKCVGASAGQSAFFQFLDHMFGVQHESKFLVSMRAYMPRQHREFLGAVEKLPSLRDIIDARSPTPTTTTTTDRDQTLVTAFHAVLEAFRLFRTRHIAIVSRYIVQPVAAEARRLRAEGKPTTEARGTAGSKPVPFLKQYRDETVLR
ncbi:hypothetical protein PV08_04114 [Exophiala spinifera]|uniref:Indoleamine 2,3-dioxygenase n=1 Tax=Exophiala spinifera TaxID=91928 RepID=A0A0D2BZZ3_9EURO|nr:uncharacterized protein PV08_04114 [Exophiala spinifera]KIW16924.1 hypothetical protein PV08_04114 [Exophiala spinifera]